jgi:branched-chain amino acid transport system permease protein
MPPVYSYGAFIVAVAAIAAIESPYLTNLAIIIFLHTLPALGLALLLGYTGQISLGHAGFYGLGAYVSAIVSMQSGLSPWLATVVAAAAVGAIAWLLGWIIFRLKGHHLAIATLGFGIIAYVAFVELRDYTGGPVGLIGIPPFEVFGFALRSDVAFLPVAAAACLLGIAAASNLVRSPFGYVMRGVADNERASASVGIDVARIKRIILIMSAVYASLGGSLYAHYIGFVSPAPFNVSFSIKLLLMVAVGGFSSVWGILFAVLFITLITEPLQELGYYDVVVFGLLLIVIAIKCPQGLLQGLLDLGAGLWRRASGLKLRAER